MEMDTPEETHESTTSTILSTALSNANIEATLEPVVVPKKPMPTPTMMRQKTEMTRNIINRTIVPKPAPQAIITRITPGPNQRNKPQFTPKQVSTPLGHTPQFRRNVKQHTHHTYSNRSAIRKIGSTSVYQTVQPVVQQVPKEPTIVATTSKTNVIPSTSTVINMPLLSEPEPEPMEEAEEEAVPAEASELSTISLAESETPLLITGEDGTIYQVRYLRRNSTL